MTNVCETWSLKLRKERKLRVPEKRILRLILESERDEIGELKMLFNNEFLNLYYSPNIISH
jgi:hypothetical protein